MRMAVAKVVPSSRRTSPKMTPIVKFFLLCIVAGAVQAQDEACTSLGGQCLNWYDYICTAGWATGKCSGDNARRCCLPCDSACVAQEQEWQGSDSGCTAKNGVCRKNSNYCDGVYLGGLCGGPSDRQCCAPSSCPKIVTRAEWGARPPTSISYLSSPVPYTVIHHTESGTCYDIPSCSSLVRGFQDYHMDSNGWADIGYNFLIGQDGNAYEGRGWDRQGAHSPNFNSMSIGISYIGSFSGAKPNDAAINAGKALIECGVAQGKIQQAYSLMGHRQDIQTDCPGDALYAEIQSWPHWDSNPY